MSAFVEAVKAVDRTVFGGLERNFRFLSAFRADRMIHLTGLGAIDAGFAGRSAVRAPLRFVREALFGVEFLLGSGEHELGTTFDTFQGLVFKHVVIHSFFS